MRLWSLHPQYLDPKGLVALWREALLAQAVLRGVTKGYRHHPQLERFRAHTSPPGFLAEYLRAVHAESVHRGYRFDARRIAPERAVGRIDVPRGQMEYEWEHLRRKLDARAPDWRDTVMRTASALPHPLFRVVAGGVADWERTAP